MSNFYDTHKGMMTSNKDDWETPQALFDSLDATYHFGLDAASSHENAKCAEHFTAEDDGLSKDWVGPRHRMVQSAIWEDFTSMD